MEFRLVGCMYFSKHWILFSRGNVVWLVEERVETNFFHLNMSHQAKPLDHDN